MEGCVGGVDAFVAEMKKLTWKRFVERGRIELDDERYFDAWACVEETKAFSLKVREVAVGAEVLSLAFG